MVHSRPWLAVATIVGTLWGWPASFAGIPQPLSEATVAELAAHASTIVIGRCIDVRSDWDAQGRVIQTLATYEVERWIKGSRTGGQVRVRLLGGTVGEISQVAVGGPVARTGERVVLFLSPADDAFALADWNRGKLPVVSNGSGADVIVAAASADPLPRRTPGRVQPDPVSGPTSQVEIPVHALERIVRGAEEAAP
jgi:hypothetical protein